MATNFTPQRFAIQQVFDILLLNPETNVIEGYISDCKTSNFNNEGTLVYPQGGKGNVYVAPAFVHSKRSRLEITHATWETSLIGLQVGSTVVIGSNENTVQYDRKTVDTNAAYTTFTALGAAGEEVGLVYVMRNDGTVEDVLVQDAIVGAGKFTYTPGTKKLTFNPAELADGTKISCTYKFDSGTSAQTITISASTKPNAVNVVAYGTVMDICTGELYKCQILGFAQIDCNWSWALDAAGEPAPQNFNLEFVRHCTDDVLCTIIVYNEADGE